MLREGCCRYVASQAHADRIWMTDLSAASAGLALREGRAAEGATKPLLLIALCMAITVIYTVMLWACLDELPKLICITQIRECTAYYRMEAYAAMTMAHSANVCLATFCLSAKVYCT